MVNIQIRGDLFRLNLKTIPTNKNFNSIINSNLKKDLKSFIK